MTLDGTTLAIVCAGSFVASFLGALALVAWREHRGRRAFRKAASAMGILPHDARPPRQSSTP